MRRLRVLITPDWYPWPDRPVFGGFCREQARAVALLHDVVVLTWHSEPHGTRPFAVSSAQEDGLLTYRVRFRPSGRPKLRFTNKLLGILVALERLRRDGWTPDVVHAHEYSAGRTALAIGRLNRAPVVISEHLSGFALGSVDADQMDLARRVFRSADLISPASHDLSRRLAGLAGDTPVVPMPTPVDTTVFRPGRPSRSPQTRLLSVGNLVEVKGHRYLIDALAQLRSSGMDARLDIVGDGPLRGPLEDHVDRLGLGNAVRFHGVLTKPRVADTMRAADVFVLPSLWETMGSVLIEAMASGLPSVASRVGGVPEVVDERVGLLVEPGSPRAIVTALDEIVANQCVYEAAVLHETAVRQYGYDAIGHQWAKLYASTGAGSKRRS